MLNYLLTSKEEEHQREADALKEIIGDLEES